MLQRFGILPGAGGFVGGNLREPGDALGLFLVRFRQCADLGLELAEQLDEFAFVRFAYGVRAADFRLNFAFSRTLRSSSRRLPGRAPGTKTGEEALNKIVSKEI